MFAASIVRSCHQVRWVQSARKMHFNQSIVQPSIMRTLLGGKQYFSSNNNVDAADTDNGPGMTPIQNIASSIDTTLTPEQQEYVNKLKKKIRGGINSPRCKLTLGGMVSFFATDLMRSHVFSNRLFPLPPPLHGPMAPSASSFIPRSTHASRGGGDGQLHAAHCR
jgi:hypothetical protein